MKVVIVDTLLATPANTVFGFQHALPALDAWIGVLAFSGQIFSDFAGYSTCAIGVAMCLGFVLPENFRYPYAAVGFSDFWRRWHSTLSAWLRDYLYIPLGGNRKGELRTYINLMITMLLGGLWHGASWTFVAWGALHGFSLYIEKLIQERFAGGKPKMTAGMITTTASFVPNFIKNKTFNRFLLALFTFFLVTVTWVFFRATDFSTAWRMLSSMFGQAKHEVALLPTLDIIKVSIIIPVIVLLHWFMRNTSVLQLAYKIRWWGVAGIWAFLVIALIVSQKSGDSFIYFQF